MRVKKTALRGFTKKSVSMGVLFFVVSTGFYGLFYTCEKITGTTVGEDVGEQPFASVTPNPDNADINDIYTFSWDPEVAIAACSGGHIYLLHIPTETWFNYSYTESAQNFYSAGVAYFLGLVVGGDLNSEGKNLYFLNGDTNGFRALPNSIGTGITDLAGYTNFIASTGTDVYKYEWDSGRIIPAGDHALPTEAPVAVSLSNGDAFVYGGGLEEGSDELNRVWIYNHTLMTWQQKGQMDPGRMWAAAVHLPDNRIAVIGGTNKTKGVLGDILLYDPTTETYTTGANMSEKRMQHQAVLLRNGTIFVFGGYDGNNALSTGEIYDPAADKWYTIPPLPGDPRTLFCMELLPDGNVLVTGGENDSGTPLNDSWVYNTASNAWEGPYYMNEARRAADSAVLSNGTVLIAGGINETLVSTNTAELFDPHTRNWTYVHPMAYPRAFHRLVSLYGGTVLAIGGENNSGTNRYLVEHTEEYSEGHWSVNGDEWSGEAFATAFVCDRKVLIVGGVNYSGSAVGTVHDAMYDRGYGKMFSAQPYYGWGDTITDVETDWANGIYYILNVDSTNGTSTLYAMSPEGTEPYYVDSYPRTFHNLAVNPKSGSILLQGNNGYMLYLNVTGTVYADALDRIPITGARPTAREKFSMESTDGGAILFGGRNTSVGYLDDTWVWIPDSDMWINITPTLAVSPPPREGGAVTFISSTDSFLLFGGKNSGGYLDDTWIFNTTSMQWEQVTSALFPPAREGAMMAYFPPDNSVYLFGGEGTDGKKQDMWRFDPETKEWNKITGITFPPGRAWGAMEYDSYNSTIVLFGGEGETGALNDIWVFDGSTWSERTPSGDIPCPRYGVASIYDRDNNRMIIYGGTDGTSTYNETYAYYGDTNTWENITAINAPRIRFASIGSGWNTFYVFGGSDENNNPKNTVYRHVTRVYPIITDRTEIDGLPSSAVINDMAWNRDGTKCMLVGDGGAIYSYVPGHWRVANHTDPAVTSSNLLCVDYKPQSSPGLFLIGGRFGTTLKAYDTQVTSEVRASVYRPHVNSVEILSSHNTGTEANDVSVLNRRIDVDSGDRTTSYWIKINVSDRNGLGDLKNLTLRLWDDFGNTGTTSVFPGGTMNNTKVELFCDISGGHVWSINNDSGYGEFEIWDTDVVSINSTTEIIYVELYFGPQVRATNGTFTEAAGTTSPDQNDKTAALNDPYTWDIEAVLYDSSENSDRGYDEFGIYSFVGLYQSGLPGDQSGSGPPGAPMVLSPAGNVTFYANCPYRLNVSVTDLTPLGSSPDIIPASAIGIKGGDLSGTGYLQTSNFTGANIPQVLLGTPTGFVKPNDYGTETNTSSARNGAASVGTVVWVCHTPNVAEDTYVGTATWSLYRA